MRFFLLLKYTVKNRCQISKEDPSFRAKIEELPPPYVATIAARSSHHSPTRRPSDDHAARSSSPHKGPLMTDMDIGLPLQARELLKGPPLPREIEALTYQHTGH